jgi:uncharacterized phage protein (TIGR02220 family)
MNPTQRTALVRGLLRLADEALDPGVDDDHLLRRLRSAAKWIEETRTFELTNPDGEMKKKPTEPTIEEIREVFDHWQARTKRPTAKLNEARKTTIRARLREGFTVAQLQNVIDFAAESSFHQGENDRGNRYDWIRHIMGSSSKVERNLEKRGAVGQIPVDVESEDQNRWKELEAEAEQALGEGRNDDYNEIQEEIRSLRTNQKSSGPPQAGPHSA